MQVEYYASGLLYNDSLTYNLYASDLWGKRSLTKRIMHKYSTHIRLTYQAIYYIMRYLQVNHYIMFHLQVNYGIMNILYNRSLYKYSMHIRFTYM